jgi:hypothetical protein
MSQSKALSFSLTFSCSVSHTSFLPTIETRISLPQNKQRNQSPLCPKPAIKPKKIALTFPCPCLTHHLSVEELTIRKFSNLPCLIVGLKTPIPESFLLRTRQGEPHCEGKEDSEQEALLARRSWSFFTTGSHSVQSYLHMAALASLSLSMKGQSTLDLMSPKTRSINVLCFPR